MRTETQVTIQIKDLTVTQNLYLDPQGFLIKVFYSSSRTDTKFFKADSPVMHINQTLKIKNIIGKELEFWLCTTQGKIIAIAQVPLSNQGQVYIDLRMVNTHFGKLSIEIQARKNQIEKEVCVEPDEELLKKVQDPMEKIKRDQEERRKIRQAGEQAEALKAMKKPAITLTHYQRKEEPFV